MDIDHRSRCLIIFIYISALYTITYGLYEVENITAVAGYHSNLTVFVVNDSVTWYTARESCAEEITGAEFSITGKDFCEYVAGTLSAGTLSQFNLLDDKLLWISRIKSKDDNIVYHGNSCKKDTILTAIVQQTEGINDQTRCIVLNTSTSTYGLDDCSNKHPYICWQTTDVESTLTTFLSVTATYDNSIVNMDTDSGRTYERCKKECSWWFPCMATLYDFKTGDCLKLSALTDNLYTSGQLSLSNSSSENILDVKIGKRVYIETWQPSKSRAQHQGSFYSCTSSPETNTESTSSQETNTEICKCECENHSTMTVNSSELQDWIKNITNMLTVNKKQLSSYTRRLISAEDPRPSSKAFGTFGAVMISCVLLFISSGDILKLSLYIKNICFKAEPSYIQQRLN